MLSPWGQGHRQDCREGEPKLGFLNLQDGEEGIAQPNKEGPGSPLLPVGMTLFYYIIDFACICVLTHKLTLPFYATSPRD